MESNLLGSWESSPLMHRGISLVSMQSPVSARGWDAEVERALGVLCLLVDGANDLGNEVNVGETLMVLGDVRALCFVTILPGMEGYAHYHWRCWGFDIDDKFLILYHSYL